MRFDIKKWQDKFLIREAKLKELDFKDQNAFKKYSSQHKIQPSTQVTIAGKTTTAGEAGKEQEPGTEQPKAAASKGREIEQEEFGEILNAMDAEAAGYYDDGYEEELLGRMNDSFEDAGLFDSDEPVTYEKVAAAIDEYLPTGEFGETDDVAEDKEHLKRQMRDKFGIDDGDSDKTSNKVSNDQVVSPDDIPDSELTGGPYDYIEPDRERKLRAYMKSVDNIDDREGVRWARTAQEKMEDKLEKGEISQEEFEDLDKRWDFGDYKKKGYTSWSFFGTIQDKMGSNDYDHNPDLHGGYTDPVDILGHHNVLPSKEQERWNKDNKKDVAENILETRIYKSIQQLKGLEKK